MQLLNAAPECPELKTIILLEEPTTEEHRDAQKKGLNLISYGQLVADGEARCSILSPFCLNFKAIFFFFFDVSLNIL